MAKLSKNTRRPAKRGRPRSTLLACVSDTHAGSTVALHPDSPTQLDDGGWYHPSLPQRWLWQGWTAYWDRIAELRASHDRLCVLINGDIFDGDHHNTSQIVSRNPGAEFDIALRIYQPMLDLRPDNIFVVRGTESHVGKSGSMEEAFAARVGATPDPDAGTHSWWHWRADIHGYRVTAAHHGRIGYRPWTRQNAVSMLAAQIFYEHAARGWRHPDLALRSHFHKHQDSYTAHPTRVIQLPAWQLHTAYTHARLPEELSDIGGVAVSLRDGSYHVEDVLFKPERSGAVWSG